MFGIGVGELTILVVIVLIFGLPVLIVIGLVRLLMNGGSRRSRETDAEETRIIQEIYSGMARLERRVESLETILLDSSGAGAGK
ncbi:MAG: phage-shock protein [Candidatus Hydrogenedentes bacterium]|nr:phage-shock protein [Candidatus Hydrogenedentota bacterium]